MIEGMITAIIASCAFLFTLSRLISFKRILKYSVAVDVAGTLILALAFQGTYSGMMTGVFAGLFIAVFLTMCKKVMKLEEQFKVYLNNRPAVNKINL